MKAHTDLEQSKKLAEILPLESADMYWKNGISDKYIQCFTPFVSDDDRSNVDFEYDVPCWSLAALIDVLPKEINALGTIYSINIHTKNEKWFIDYKCNNEEFVGVHSNIFVDACYEMIIELHEQKIL